MMYKQVEIENNIGFVLVGELDNDVKDNKPIFLEMENHIALSHVQKIRKLLKLNEKHDVHKPFDKIDFGLNGKYFSISIDNLNALLWAFFMGSILLYWTILMVNDKTILEIIIACFLGFYLIQSIIKSINNKGNQIWPIAHIVSALTRFSMKFSPTVRQKTYPHPLIVDINQIREYLSTIHIRQPKLNSIENNQTLGMFIDNNYCHIDDEVVFEELNNKAIDWSLYERIIHDSVILEQNGASPDIITQKLSDKYREELNHQNLKYIFNDYFNIALFKEAFKCSNQSLERLENLFFKYNELMFKKHNIYYESPVFYKLLNDKLKKIILIVNNNPNLQMDLPQVLISTLENEIKFNTLEYHSNDRILKILDDIWHQLLNGVI